MDLRVWSSGLFIILISAVFLEASASQIIGHGDTSADYGGEAHYTCKLDEPKDVLQVIWQRVHPGNIIDNLATYNKSFGEHVNAPHKGKILFTQASLRSSSITVVNLTWADESCYVCFFDARPSGSKLHQTCLKVQGVSDVKTQVHELSESENKDSHVVFSCSATGKPAPKIQWEYSQDVTVVAKSQTLELTNDDHSLTSSRNLTLQLSPDWSGDVHCLINPGTRGERKQSIMYTRMKTITERDFEDLHRTPEGLSDVYVGISVSCVVLLCVCGAVFVALLIKNKQQKKSVPRNDKNMDNGDEISPLKSHINSGSLHKRTPMKDEPSTPSNSSRKLDVETLGTPPIFKNKQLKSVLGDDKNMENGDEITPLKSNINDGSLRQRTPQKNQRSTPSNSSSSRKLF